CTLNELYSKIIGKCIFQEYITQEEKISKIYPHSLNTVRPVTVMDHGKPFLLTPFLRVGHQGSLVDNWAGGGVIIPIDKETGRLKKHGFLQPGTGTLVTKHPDTGMEFEGFEVPYYKEMVELIMKLHKLFYGIHSIGWDIAITANGPCVIEGNDEWDLALQQTFDNGLKQFYLHSYPIIDS
ncbi:MAG: sugar-transfer associated ATP-grasp domain-containing protein, partial [Desulfobacteraceae bacterium]